MQGKKFWYFIIVFAALEMPWKRSVNSNQSFKNFKKSAEDELEADSFIRDSEFSRLAS